jgi:hypothetical protein
MPTMAGLFYERPAQSAMAEVVNCKHTSVHCPQERGRAHEGLACGCEEKRRQAQGSGKETKGVRFIQKDLVYQ